MQYLIICMRAVCTCKLWIDDTSCQWIGALYTQERGRKTSVVGCAPVWRRRLLLLASVVSHHHVTTNGFLMSHLGIRLPVHSKAWTWRLVDVCYYDYTCVFISSISSDHGMSVVECGSWLCFLVLGTHYSVLVADTCFSLVVFCQCTSCLIWILFRVCKSIYRTL